MTKELKVICVVDHQNSQQEAKTDCFGEHYPNIIKMPSPQPSPENPTQLEDSENVPNSLFYIIILNKWVQNITLI